jgi:hypothetical protein
MEPNDEISGEQAADFQRLTRAAQEPEAELAEQQEQEQEQVVGGLIEKNAQALGMLLDLASPTLAEFGFPSVGRVLTFRDPATGQTKAQMLAGVWSTVLAKHGVDLGELGGQWKEEIAAVFVTLPIAGAVYKAVLHDCKPKEKAQQAVPAAPQATPAVTVMGTPPEAVAAAA